MNSVAGRPERPGDPTVARDGRTAVPAPRPDVDRFAGLEVVRELGRGADTVVYQVLREGRPYALKVLGPSAEDDRGRLVELRREAALLGSIGHPGLPRVYEVGESGGRPYLVMDLVQGQTLADVLRSGPLPVSGAVRVAMDLAGALSAAHAIGLVHRDVKPHNVMMLEDGAARLIDFGLATRDDVTAAAGEAVGTLLYAAPEQSGMLKRPVDRRADLYALGVLLFECLTGRTPFSSADVGELLRMHAISPPPDPRKLVAGISDRLAAVVARLLAKDPDDRYQSGPELVAELRALEDDPAAATVHGAGDATGRGAAERLAGREAELDALAGRWREAVGGRGGCCLLRGAPGVGKSRLAAELAARARAAGWTVLHGKSSQDDPVPFAPLRSAVETHARAIERLPDGAGQIARDALRAAAGGVAPLLSSLSPTLGVLLSAGVLPEGDRQDQFAGAVAAFLAGLATAPEGVLLVLDDVQWLDAGSLRVLDHLLGAGLDGVPLLVLATARDDEASAAGVDRFVRAVGAPDPDVTIGPLDRHGVAGLVSAVLPGIDAPARLADLLARRGDGNPFIVQEYLHAIVDAGLLRPHWGEWLLDEQGLDRLELPQDAIGLVLSRIQNLDARLREVLVASAAVGVRFRPDVIARVFEDRLRADDVTEALTEAVSRRLVEVRADGRYAFLHDRIREALLDIPGDDSAARLHERIAEVLEASVTGAAEADPETVYAVAHHYARGVPGRCPERVFGACLRAGLLALENHAAEEAVAFLANAEGTGLGGDAGFLITYGTALQRAAQHGAAAKVLARAVAAAGSRLVRGQALVLLADNHRATWDTNDAYDTVRLGLAELGAPLPRRRWMLLASSVASFAAGLVVGRLRIGFGTASGERRKRYELIAALHDIGAYIGAISMRPELLVLHNLRSLYVLNRVGPCSRYALSVAGKSFVLAMLGLHGPARRTMRKAHRAAALTGDPHDAAAVDWYEGASGYMARLDDGERWQRALIEHERWLDAGRYTDAVASLVWEAAVRGRTAEAQEWHRRGLRRLGDAGQINSLVGTDGIALTVAGRVTEAAGRLRDAAELLRNGGEGLRINVSMATVQCLLEQGELGPPFEEAVHEYERHVQSPRRAIRQHRAFFMHLAQGRLAQARLAEPHERPARLARARAALDRLHGVADVPLLKVAEAVGRAELETLSGRPERALDVLGRMRPLAVDAPVLAFEAARTRARALLALGHRADGERYARHALAVAQEEGWSHRIGWISAEFGLTPTPVTSGGGTASVGSVLRAGSGIERQRLRALEAVSRASSRVLDPDALARIALDETIRILSADRAYLFLSQDDGEQLRPHLGRDAGGADIDQLTGYSASLIERVRHDRQPLVVTGTEEGAALGARSVVLHGLRSIIVAPMLLEGRLLGVVYLDSQVAKGIFTADDVGILTAVTNHIALSMETVRAARLEVTVAAAREAQDLAETLRAALTAMSAAGSADDVLRHLLGTTVRLLPAETVHLVLRRGDGLQLWAGEPAAPTGNRLPADPAVLRLVDAGPVVGAPGTAPPGVLAPLMGAGAGSWMAVPLRNGDRAALGLLLVTARPPATFTDAQLQVAATLVAQAVTAYEKAQLLADVQRLAVLDELTGIANRRAFYEQARSVCAQAHAGGHAVVAMMIDIDHFKQVNDRYGHPTGDDVIRAVAERLGASLGAADVLARYGGEEFVVVHVAADTRDRGDGLADRLLAAVGATPVDTRSGAIHVTISIGLAHREPGADPAAGNGLDALLVRADKGLYLAKEQGRNRVRRADD